MISKVEGASPSSRSTRDGSSKQSDGPRPVDPGSRPGRPTKLYAVGRADLPPGLRAAQLAHACIAWTTKCGKPPENLVLLEVPDEEELEKLRDRVGGLGFCEPDLGGQLTAFAVCHEDAERLLSNVPLALRPRR